MFRLVIHALDGQVHTVISSAPVELFIQAARQAHARGAYCVRLELLTTDPCRDHALVVELHSAREPSLAPAGS